MSDVVVTQSNLFVSKYTIKPGKRDEFLAIFNPLWQGAMAFMEENCHFVFYGFGRDPNVLVAIESYKSEDAVAAIRKTDAFAEIVAKMLDLCSAPMTIENFSGLDMAPDVFALYPAGKSAVHPATADNHVEFL